VLSGDTAAPAATLAVVDGLMRTRAPHSVILDILYRLSGLSGRPVRHYGHSAGWAGHPLDELVDDAPEKLVDSRDN